MKQIKNMMFGALLKTLFNCATLLAIEKPNIIYILADDMGRGDVSCYNADEKPL